MKFEFLVAIRYLRAKRKQAVISLITLISIIGVAAGVAALIIALAINAGFTEDLQNKLLGAQAHIRIQNRRTSVISDYLELTKQVEQIPGVVAAAPSIYQTVLLSSGKTNNPGIVKGIIPEMESGMSALSQNIVQGSLKDFGEGSIVLGQELANALGVVVGDPIEVVSPQMTITPMGQIPTTLAFKVVAIFSSGLYDIDSSWAYVPIRSAQRLLRVNDDIAGTIEV